MASSAILNFKLTHHLLPGQLFSRRRVALLSATQKRHTARAGLIQETAAKESLDGLQQSGMDIAQDVMQRSRGWQT